jgi:EAL domain-containing protein (putative c-di-GMP-specific phosphodiesterase class I)
MSNIATKITDDFLSELGKTKARIEHALQEARLSGDEELVLQLCERKIQISEAEAAFFAPSYHLNTVRAAIEKRKCK